MTPEMIAILAVGASLTGVNIALGGLIWQSHHALRANLSAGLREAKRGQGQAARRIIRRPPGSAGRQGDAARRTGRPDDADR